MDTWNLDSSLSPDTPLEELIQWKPYTSSEDKKGHEVFLGAKFPKSFQRWVTRLREASAGRYVVNADVVRDAIYLGLTIISLRLQQKQWDVERMVAHHKAKLLEKAHIYSVVEEIAAGLDMLCANNDQQTAIAELEEFVNAARSLENFDKYMTALREKLAQRRLQGLLDQLE